ncbi:hypothetical protein [Roseovarius nubinhibens]|uniref:hypothetical protein n=1 Tax=Roseovarius nubinhibens TaxID=314263 RepID=UPI0003211346|nr:hypothetical protein [Roseovarius nubinhibens]
MSTILYASVAVISVFFLAFLIGFLMIVCSVSSSRWREAHRLSPSPKKVIMGEVVAEPNGLRDPRIAKGKVWDTATENWLPQGKLSDEYLNGLAG